MLTTIFLPLQTSQLSINGPEYKPPLTLRANKICLTRIFYAPITANLLIGNKQTKRAPKRQSHWRASLDEKVESSSSECFKTYDVAHGVAGKCRSKNDFQSRAGNWRVQEPVYCLEIPHKDRLHTISAVQSARTHV
ncbi:hypothetical protein CBL_02271 [Carabus blaptoides fortunei]